jgi:hypothetical protein
MNYKRIYNSIVENANKQNRKKKAGVLYERHHIVPKSIGGSNNRDNLVLLTPKEHYICHRLLVEIHKGTPNENKMYYAMWCMVNGVGNQKRYATSSRIFTKLREEFIKTYTGNRYDTRKAIEQYDLNGNYITFFDSAKTASEVLKISRGTIENCARGECKTAGGFNWKYLNSDKQITEVTFEKVGVKKGNIPWSKGLKPTPGSRNIEYKKVHKYTLEGIFLEEYETINLAAQSVGVGRGAIENCCLGKCKTVGGFNWKYQGSSKVIVSIQYEKAGRKPLKN